MGAHPQIIAFVKRALDHELGAVQQYLLQSVQAEAWGLKELARELREGVQEELRHAELLAQRLAAWGVSNAQTRAIGGAVGRSEREILQLGAQTEERAIRLYEDAVRYCQRVRDADSETLLSAILADEVTHYRFLIDRLSKLAGGD